MTFGWIRLCIVSTNALLQDQVYYCIAIAYDQVIVETFKGVVQTRAEASPVFNRATCPLERWLPGPCCWGGVFASSTMSVASKASVKPASVSPLRAHSCSCHAARVRPQVYSARMPTAHVSELRVCPRTHIHWYNTINAHDTYNASAYSTYGYAWYIQYNQHVRRRANGCKPFSKFT